MKERLLNTMQQGKRSPRGRMVLAIGAVVVVAALVASAIYVFGGGGGAKTSTPPTVPTLATNGNGTIFTIDPSASEASFTIDEVLFGQPNTVVGKTSSVAGQIQVNRQNPAQSQVGEIKVDVSTLLTDNDLRNHTLQGRILETGDAANQYATFVPKSLTGMPATVTVGQQVSFQITGALTIHQVTRTTTFDVKATLQSDTLLKGQAQATVKYQDFGMSIPNVPSVTDVGENVVLALSFTAKA